MMGADWVAALGALGQAAALGGTAFVGWRGITAWRAQLVGKRRIEIAEQALVATYRVKDAFAFIRSPATGSLPAKSRERAEGESEQESKLLDSYFVPIERVNEAAEAFAEFQTARLLCQVHFGPRSIDPFDQIMKLRARIVAGATRLSDSVREGSHGGAKDAPLLRQWQSAIWNEGAADQITPLLDGAVADIEELCRQHLRVGSV